MSVFAVFVLSTAITIESSRSPSGDEGSAMKALAKATVVETGLDKRMKYLEKKYIPEKVRKYTGWATLVIKVQQEKRISYEWTF